MVRTIPFLFALVCVWGMGSPAVASIYWTDITGSTGTKKIFRTNEDGTGSIELVLSGLNSPRGIAVHPTQGIFWADSADNAIYQTNFDGMGKTAIVTGTNTLRPIALTLDLTNGRMYWSDSGSSGDITNRIQSAKLDGTDIQPFTAFGSLSSFTGIEVDPDGGKLYWVDSNSVNEIWRGNLDGTNIELIMPHVASTGDPNDLGLDLVGGKMYWSTSSTIEWANLDGSNRQTFAGSLNNSRGVEVDGGKVYWESNAGIERANLDGSGRETIAGSANAWGLTLGPASAISAVPEPSTLAIWSLLGLIGAGVAWRRPKGKAV